MHETQVYHRGVQLDLLVPSFIIDAQTNLARAPRPLHYLC